MSLDSYLEIFTTFYGWAFANIIGEVLVGTGLVVLPFAIMVFQAWYDAKDQGNEANTVMGLIDRIGLRLWSCLFVMSVCFATNPVTSLHRVNLTYTPPASLADPNPDTASSQSGTGSGFDQAMANAQDGTVSAVGDLTYVPAWWYSVMAISSGLNQSFKAGLANAGGNLRMVEETARQATISDPKLRADVQRFYSECFMPARSQFLRADGAGISSSGAALLAPTNTAYGPTDVDWMGSQFFRTEPGYYMDNRSYNPVPGFAIDFSRDTEYYNGAPPADGSVINPEWGRPTCSQWWEDSTQGIRARLVNHAGTWQELLARLGTVASGMTDDQKTDMVARLAATKSNPKYVDPTGLGNESAGFVDILRGAGGVVSTVGLSIANLVAAISFVPLVTGLLMMQALILMGMYMFLPLVTFFSGFNLKVMFLGAVAIFTVKFWAVMWAIAVWVDAHLVSAMYPNLVNWGQIAEFLSGETVAIITNGYKRALLNLLLIGMLVGLPTLWTGMMVWAGAKLGAQLDGLMGNANSTAQQLPGKTPIAGKFLK